MSLYYYMDEKEVQPKILDVDAFYFNKNVYNLL